MKGREITSNRMVWLAWAVAMLVCIATQYLIFLIEPAREAFIDGISTAIVAILATTGALIVARRPENLIGRFYFGGACLLVAGFLCLNLGVYAIVTAPGTLPGGGLLAVTGTALRDLGWMTLVIFPLLFFPDGRLPSRRWRPVIWLGTVFIALHTVLTLIQSGTTDFRLRYVQNPLALASPDGIVGKVDQIGFLPIFIVVALSAAAVIVRFRRASGFTRLQIKWVAYVAVVPLILLFGALATGFISLSSESAASRVGFGLIVLPVPLGIGIAILRYRLYDIDRIINRVLVYTAMTVSLAGVYIGGVLLLQYLLSPLTRQSDLAIALSTLVVAALFQPLRHRFQRLVDRRFYRQRYDAARILATFGTTARDEMDLEQLSGALVQVIGETIQPEHVSLWLRDAGGTR